MPKCQNANIALFADDTLFYASSTTNNAASKKLQDQINLCIPWFTDWKISINPSKTKAILFSHKSSLDSNKIKFYDSPIDWSPAIKYLGVTIDRKLNFVTHVNNTVNKAKAAKSLLYPLINPRSPLPLSIKLYIYKAYIRPIILYAAPTWTSNLSTKSWSKLEKVQSITLRQITNSPWFVSNKTIRSSASITSIKDLISKDAALLSTRIKNSPYNHISNIINRPSSKEHFRKRPLII
jgi:hypothetical protein